MSGYRSVLSLTTLVGSLGLLAACGSGPDPDADFAALQARGEVGMGVDQYASTHLFDALPDGGRIEFQHDEDDVDAVAQIRSHLREIQVSFKQGDFSIPAFVHDQPVPGTDVMAQRSEHIEYLYQDLPRGGELRLVTQDPDALAAIRDFMAFQRADHRAAGMDHAAMDHGAMDHSSMTPGSMDHAPMHGEMDHGSMGHDGMEPGAMGNRNQHYMEMGGGDPAFAADMELIHELLTHHRAITRTVEHLPNGIRTLTESSIPAVAGLIVSHVASMQQRLETGDVFNLFSHTLPVIFEKYDRIESEFEYVPTGVWVVQTSDDPELVAALQGHAAEVTEMVDEGMIVMMRGMMERRMQGGGGMMQQRMQGGGGMGGGAMHRGGGMHQQPAP